MELLLISAVPVVSAGAAFVIGVSAVVVLFWVEAWLSSRFNSLRLANPGRSRKTRS